MPAFVKIEVVFVSILAILQLCNTATIKDVLTDSSLIRVPRDSKYLGRYNSRTEDGEKNLKPEESQDNNDNQGANLGKRCIRCDNGYSSSSYDRYPDDRRGYPDDRRGYSDDRRGYYDDRSRDRDYDRYDDRYDRYDRERPYDRYDRDRYYPSRSRYPARNDRYDRYDKYNDRYDYDRYEPYDRYDRYDRYSDRGVGYDNRGYDYRSSDRESYRPWDETYRGSSGFDSSGRGYYFASGGRPEYSGQGYGYGSGRYASGWDYGSSGGGRDEYRDRGYYGSSYRPYRDPYDGYRTTSYLYGRPSSTTIKPPNSGDNGNTQSPQESSG